MYNYSSIQRRSNDSPRSGNGDETSFSFYVPEQHTLKIDKPSELYLLVSFILPPFGIYRYFKERREHPRSAGKYLGMAAKMIFLFVAILLWYLFL